VSKTSIKCLPDIREDLESGLERLLECSSQKLSKLEDIRPRGYSRAQKGTGPPPEISRDKAFQSKVTLGEVSREPFPDIRRTYRRLLPDVSKISRDTRAGTCGTRRFRDTYIFSRCLASARQILWDLSRTQTEPLAYLGACKTVQHALEARRANILSQHGDRIPYGIHLPHMLPQMAREDGHCQRKTMFPLQKQGRCRISAI